MTAHPEAPMSIREVICRLVAADRYPCLGNADWRQAEILEQEALALATTATPSPDDPPEFASWLATLNGPEGRERRQAVFDAIYDFEDAERVAGRAPFGR